MRRRWANVARPTITRRRVHSECIRWPNVGSTSTFQLRPIRPCTDVGSTLPGRPSPDVAHTQNAYVGSTSTCRLRPIRPCADIGPCNVALAVNHYPTSRTIEIHMLPQCWLDIDILTMHQIPPCADFGPALPARPSPDIAHTENAYVGSTSKFQPRPIRRCTGIGSTLPGRPLYQTSRTIKMHMLTQCWLDVNIPTMYCNPTMCGRWASVAQPSITQCCAHSKCQR